jgi:hypothetical protein
MDDKLVISTNEAETKQHTLGVSCKYLRGIFGAPLSILNQCCKPNGMSTREELNALSFDDLIVAIKSKNLSKFTLPIPKEVSVLLTFLDQYGKA